MITHPPENSIAVIFTSILIGKDMAGYYQASQEMEDLARKQNGFLGIDSARSNEGLGITVSYWQDEESAKAWKKVSEHSAVQRKGREKWYQEYVVNVARITRNYKYKKVDKL